MLVIKIKIMIKIAIPKNNTTILIKKIKSLRVTALRSPVVLAPGPR